MSNPDFAELRRLIDIADKWPADCPCCGVGGLAFRTMFDLAERAEKLEAALRGLVDLTTLLHERLKSEGVYLDAADGGEVIVDRARALLDEGKRDGGEG